MPRPAVRRALLAAALSLAAAVPARADIRVGIDVSTTGPAASIGIPSKNTVLMWPATLGGQKAQYIVLDDASDPAGAVRNVRKLISEDKVDVIVGPNITPTALAALDAVSEGETPMVALAASAAIVEPQSDPKRRWAFKMPQNDSHMATVLTEYMSNHGIRTVGFIGFNDAYGESWWREFSKLAEVRKIKVVANERFSRNDTSVTGQVLKLMAANPDAILIAGAGTPSVLPQKTLGERGYKGRVYQTHGIATWDFLRVGGKDVEGTLFPTGPVVVARQLPDSHPVKKVALDFAKRYEARYGADSVTQFAGDAWGAWMLLDDAARRALKSGAQPGTREFRQAMRDAIESTAGLTIPNGVMNMSANDHQGFDQRSRVMGVIRDGKFAYAAGQ
ncbi:branched-chain amino acid ABC transporter substrate-binding protein [Cupriavidus sp. USMAA2-4]|uniref:ABC transporter substrate-binding protein n=1 Tax=unclassified Cupriavidus TaxID=2640874 RepID=UPI0008A6A939|nr:MULTISPECIES: ABC transporter substrate-binding protein [unclassified Cupriavidus]AOY92930.1 branched-chain amino acid ABC transporter substrate-binding protein [Cupriavidus sp. USMAA2-4]AOZ00653.1 branched-chain amino acid ABC transporter substrate-binding protein [Cupriavidus sp. USMAHM13]